MRSFEMAKTSKNKTTITLTVEAGKIVDVKAGEGTRVTKVNAPDIEKISRRQESPRYVTTMTYTEEAGMCCYYISIGGRWTKVCCPC
jgi:hypothetical protein